MGNLGDAPIKKDGEAIAYDGSDHTPSKPKIDATYVERRVPRHLEDKLHEVIDMFLCYHGYDPDEI